MIKNNNKGMTNSFILLIIFIIVIGVGVYISKNVQEETSNNNLDESQMVDDSQKEDAMNDSIVEDDVMMENKVLGTYEVYSPEKLEKAQTGDVVLFFHAPWCPTCRALDTDINNSITDIPEGVTILKTDYDTSDELKKKYGVTYQHTLVQVDSEGNMINKWSGSNTLESILSNIK